MEDSLVIGKGMVGNATMHSLGIKNYISKSSNNIEGREYSKFKYIFICLPTPTIDGKQDISIIESYLSQLSGYTGIVVIRSTILPGTSKRLSEQYKLNIVHVPEFLTESTWEKDSLWPDIIVIGSDNEKTREDISGIFKARFKGAVYFLTDTITSETIKYAINTFYATKVVFANQIYDFAKKTGANYETIKEALYARKWIGSNHLDVWHNNKRGAGGKCLEKDLEAFSALTKLPLLETSNVINKQLLGSATVSENKQVNKNESAARCPSSGDRVYFIKDGKKHWIKNPETLIKLGFNFSSVKNITNEEMDSFETDEAINLKEPVILEVETKENDYDRYNL